jgi:uncharacterized protein (DUF302 family)
LKFNVGTSEIDMNTSAKTIGQTALMALFDQEFHTMSVQGLVTYHSTFGPKDTAERAISAIEARGIPFVASVDHAVAADKVRMALRPTLLLIFGNPKAGTPLMQVGQTMGIDLPLKLLIWEDGLGQTNLSYNDPEWLARRHSLDDYCAETLAVLSQTLADVAVEATGEPQRGALTSEA